MPLALLIPIHACWLVLALALSPARLAAQPVFGGDMPLRPGDGVRLRVFDEALEGQFTLDERSVLVIPKAGEVSLAAVPADSVRPYLVRELRRYLQSEMIEVIPFRRVAITGAVASPGLYEVPAGLSVGDAIILAGGYGAFAREGQVELRPAGRDRQTLLVTNDFRVWVLPLQAGDQLYVPRRGWVRRNGLQTLQVTLNLAMMVSFIAFRFGGR